MLSDRQRSDLNNSIYEYLLQDAGRYASTIKAFQVEGGIGSTYIAEGKQVLEKKWISVVRLQKKVLELEAQVQLLQSQSKGVFDSVGKENGSSIGGSLNEFKAPKQPCKGTLSGHRSPILALAMHPAFSILASASEDTTIKLWDYETMQYERTLKSHTGSVTGVVFDSTGSTLASCSVDMTIKLWDMTTYSCVKTLRGHDHSISAVLFTKGNEHIISCSRDNSIKYWEVSSGFCIKTFTGHSDWVRCISISLNGELLASGSSDQSIIVWNTSSGASVQVLRGHEHVIETLSFGKKPITAVDVTKMMTADASNGNNANNDSELFSYLVSGSRDKSIKLWDPLKGELLMSFNSHANWVRGVVLHPSGKYIISVSDDKSIKVIDIKQGSCIKTITDAHDHFITSLALSQQRPILATASVDWKINIWDCSS